MKSRLSAFTICLLFVLLAIAPASGIKVSGVILVTDVSPGEDILHLMTVDIGESGEAVDVVAQLYGCGMALDGSRVQLPAEEDSGPYSARGFLKLDPERVTVEPGAKTTIILQGTVPQDVGDGGRYALVNIATVPKGSELVGVSSAVEVPVFLTINGSEIVETGEITDVKASEEDEGLLMDVMFENTGNHHYRASVEAVLKDGEGNVAAEATAPLSENSIIPTYTRLFPIQFDEGEDLASGTYTVEVSVIKEDGTVLDTAEMTIEV